MDTEERAEQERLRQAIRTRLLEAAEDAYALAGVQGLCQEGRVDLACDAVRTCEVGDLLEDAGAPLSEDALEELRSSCVRRVVAGAFEDEGAP